MTGHMLISRTSFSSATSMRRLYRKRLRNRTNSARSGYHIWSRMIEAGQKAPEYGSPRRHIEAYLLVFLETDCATCRLAIPYLNKLARQSAPVIGISQDSEILTRQFAEQTSIAFPVELDRDLQISRAYDPVAVPAFFLINAGGRVIRTQIGFNKEELNA